MPKESQPYNQKLDIIDIIVTQLACRRPKPEVCPIHLHSERFADAFIQSDFEHTFTHQRPHTTTASSSGAVRVRRLTQGHRNTQLGGAGDRTSNLPVTSQPALPPETHAAPQKRSEVKTERQDGYRQESIYRVLLKALTRGEVFVLVRGVLVLVHPLPVALEEDLQGGRSPAPQLDGVALDDVGVRRLLQEVGQGPRRQGVRRSISWGP